MPDISAILGLPYLLPSQAQKHVTHNEALRLLDILVQLRLVGIGAETPPETPVEGEIHALGETPTGDWAGQAHMLAVWLDAGWSFLAPQPGWHGWDMAKEELRIWDGSTWVLPASNPDRLNKLGIRTDADAVNRLAISAEASLFSHDGAGHQLKINKADTGDTASLLFQSNYTGHAEMGLAGNTGFSIKTSPDGAAWSDALVVDPASGNIGIWTNSPDTALDVAGATRVETGGSARSVFHAEAGNASYDKAIITANAHRAAHADFAFFEGHSGDMGDLAFRLGGDGNAACDGAWSGGGADYAEWFEWADGNPASEDRRGLSVVLEGGKIRPALPGEDPIGVISGNPSVVGDGDIGRWKGKYQRDVFGSYLQDAAGQRQLAPEYDAQASYLPRAARPEWAMVGLLGKLRLKNGQPTGQRWIHMETITEDVSEWLVR
ncbi:peptidase G2 autoproteolytic cleavage domain-containing protein [Heliomarina baculiformis]|uniref:peptidase G2 autoproteolytic cleavage domain-containing protein n=1 Tax=Heliomarina baculiformis TaxID=2872036 RepID=UPI001EE1B722|nr:peptidase G2 autoproteolytic cleavage domain-containing protein [Heliomarina baculiformis]